jgi:hypothetical protein
MPVSNTRVISGTKITTISQIIITLIIIIIITLCDF